MQEEVRQRIEDNLRSFAVRGIARKPGDMDACLRYCEGLTASEQQIFDDLLEEGTFAGSAAELIEVLSGREQPQGAKKFVGASAWQVVSSSL